MVVPGGTPAELVAAALRAINLSLGGGIDPARIPAFNAGTWCPELAGGRVVRNLYDHGDARRVAERFIGPGRVAPVYGGQIALRFPQAGPPAAFGPHLDGMYYPGNGVPEGEVCNFTALAGVLLSDVPGPDAGNLVVYPGSHRLNAEYFREHGPESLRHGMPKVDLPPAVQVTGRAGDVVLCHYLMSHAVASNVSPHVRYAAYFRLSHVDHASRRWQSMVDPWVEWEGVGVQ